MKRNQLVDNKTDKAGEREQSPSEKRKHCARFRPLLQPSNGMIDPKNSTGEDDGWRCRGTDAEPYRR